MGLWACKKQSYIEPSKTQTFKQKIIDRQALEAVKTWYSKEQEDFKTMRKASRNQGIDSLPFLPQWNKASSFSLSDSSKLLVAPVLRYASIHYNM